LTLTGRPTRLPYKFGNIARYWRDKDRIGRREELAEVWRDIVRALEREIVGVADMLVTPPVHGPPATMKAFEDTLDAVVCAWVRIRALEGRAEAIGDSDSAIWVPTEHVVS